MSKKLLFLILVPILLVCCQQELDGEIRSRGQGDSTLLIRRVDESMSPGQVGKYTSIYDYAYDAEKRLVRVEFNSVSGTRTGKGVTRYIRDSKGRIETIENISKQFVNGVPYVSPEGIRDTSIINYVYQDETSHKISYSKQEYQVGDKTAKDSIVYQYNTAGKLAKTLNYYLPAVHLPGDTLAMTSYSAYLFDGSGNLTEHSFYNESNGNFTLNMRYRLEYDNKLSPLCIQEDMFVSFWSEYAAHNIVKQNVYIPSSQDDYDNTAVYQYLSNDKPASVAYFSPVVSGTRETKFYYR